MRTTLDGTRSLHGSAACQRIYLVAPLLLTDAALLGLSDAVCRYYHSVNGGNQILVGQDVPSRQTKH